MVKKFVVKPWMIVVASVVVIGGVTLFFVLNKGDNGTKSTPTDKSSPSVKKSFTPTQYSDYIKITKEKIKKAEEAEEQCKREKHPTEERNYKSCEDKELAEIAKAELELLEEKEKIKEEKEGKKPKPLTPARLKVLRKKAQQRANQVILKKRMDRIPGCAKVNKKGGCAQCEKGLFIDESGKCQGSSSECNDPYHIAQMVDKKIQLIPDEIADELLQKGKDVKCVCPEIHPGAQGSMYKYKDGVCQRKFKTKNGFEYKDSFEEGDEDVYASNKEKKNAFNKGILHPDFKEGPFYQEEEDKDEKTEENKEENKKEDNEKDLTEEQKKQIEKINKLMKKAKKRNVIGVDTKDKFVITPACVF